MKCTPAIDESNKGITKSFSSCESSVFGLFVRCSSFCQKWSCKITTTYTITKSIINPQILVHSIWTILSVILYNIHTILYYTHAHAHAHALKVLNADFISLKENGNFHGNFQNMCIIASPNKSHHSIAVVAAVVFIVATIFNSYYFKLSSHLKNFVAVAMWRKKLNNIDEKKITKNLCAVTLI